MYSLGLKDSSLAASFAAVLDVLPESWLSSLFCPSPSALYLAAGALLAAPPGSLPITGDFTISQEFFTIYNCFTALSMGPPPKAVRGEAMQGEEEIPAGNEMKGEASSSALGVPPLTV